MNKNEIKEETAIRISLLDVMYGVVLGYGFTSFDSDKEFVDYVRFFFAYAIFVVDWIYVHQLYWGAEVKNIYLVLDIGILFSISRLLATASDKTGSYFSWLSVLFVFYVIWDIISRIKKLSSTYDWRYSIIGDSFASLVFFIFWIACSKKILQPQSILLMMATLIVYFIAVLSWFKKEPRHKT